MFRLHCGRSGRFAEGLRGSKTIGPDVSSDDLLGDARIAIIVRLITRSTMDVGRRWVQMTQRTRFPLYFRYTPGLGWRPEGVPVASPASVDARPPYTMRGGKSPGQLKSWISCMMRGRRRSGQLKSSISLCSQGVGEPATINIIDFLIEWGRGSPGQ